MKHKFFGIFAFLMSMSTLNASAPIIQVLHASRGHAVATQPPRSNQCPTYALAFAEQFFTNPGSPDFSPPTIATTQKTCLPLFGGAANLAGNAADQRIIEAAITNLPALSPRASVSLFVVEGSDLQMLQLGVPIDDLTDKLAMATIQLNLGEPVAIILNLEQHWVMVGIQNVAGVLVVTIPESANNDWTTPALGSVVQPLLALLITPPTGTRTPSNDPATSPHVVSDADDSAKESDDAKSATTEATEEKTEQVEDAQVSDSQDKAADVSLTASSAHTSREDGSRNSKRPRSPSGETTSRD